MLNKKGMFIVSILLTLAGLVSASEAQRDIRFRAIVYFYPGVTDSGIVGLPGKFEEFQEVDDLP